MRLCTRDRAGPTARGFQFSDSRHKRCVAGAQEEGPDGRRAGNVSSGGFPHSPLQPNSARALLLVLLTGCRSGEIVAGRWRDIDLDRAIWTLRETKNGEPHDVMLSQQAIELLRYRQSIDKTFVFPSPRARQHVAQKALGLAQYTARHVESRRRCCGSDRSAMDGPRSTTDSRHGAREARLSASCAGSHSQPRRHVYRCDLRPTQLRREARIWLQKWADYMDALKTRNVFPLSAVKVA